ACRDQAVDEIGAEAAGGDGGVIGDRRLLRQEGRRHGKNLARRLERGREDPEDRDDEEDRDGGEEHVPAGGAERRSKRGGRDHAHRAASADWRLSVATTRSEASAVIATRRIAAAEPPAKSNLKNIWR